MPPASATFGRGGCVGSFGPPQAHSSAARTNSVCLTKRMIADGRQGARKVKQEAFLEKAGC
jgi:hypothetical protein